MWPIKLAGWTGPSTYAWVLLSLQLGGLYAVASIGVLSGAKWLKTACAGWRIRRSSTTLGNTAAPRGEVGLAITVRKTSRRIASEAASIVIVALCSFAMGYLYRSHQEVQNTFTFHDVRILRRADAHRWLLSTSYTGEWWVTICPDYVPTTWQPGYTLKLLVYEDMGCKRLSGAKTGFVIARDEDGKPIKEAF
jgi:hypothetical protein